MFRVFTGEAELGEIDYDFRSLNSNRMRDPRAFA